ncbi:origin recognition complex subunit 1 [Cuculus canorus]|uniref:origin recognition complex subunit 1 n=1 Tax=Cuculus canorus TaxID=55661 RepID=UPI0023AABA81|nr:origin recognition complex subunit 1 [Cuculus canorus]XP_053928361.1 origin recognition complex subunit 1 [Cuculus canorus]XP_053928362.1 origin recognition complex subunit 1 [Cuculus canorus]
MNAWPQNKLIYSWYGKPTNSDRRLRTFQYKGILIKSERSRREICIQLGDFILVEGENADQNFVAQLLELYEDGAQRKRAVVQWFANLTEIPQNKQKLLKTKVHPHEVFFDQVSGYDTDIAVETIIKTVTVIPLHLGEQPPISLNKEEIFYVKRSWDGKCFKALSPRTFSKLKEANKKGDGILNSSDSFIPSDTISPLKKEIDRVVRSATKEKNVELQMESKHSASKASVAKERHSQRMANGLKTPTARKKLQLNSPTKSPKSKLLGCEVLELLDDDHDTLAPLEPSATKRKVKFTGLLGSPSKISCVNGKSTFDAAEQFQGYGETIRLSPYKKGKDSSEKAKNLDMKVDAISLIGHQEPDAQSLVLTPRSRRTCTQKTSARIAEQISILNALELNQEDFLSGSESSYSSSSEEEESDVPCTPEKKIKSNRTFSTPKSSRKSSVQTPAKTPKKTPLPGTPKTPRNATPEIPRRHCAAQKPVSILEEARLRLHVSATPESLPCREEEFQDIFNFVESKLIDGTGGCMYISGVPGTGKTATVHEVIRRLQQAAEDDDLPPFQFVEVNGMKLTEPHQAYVQILELLTGQKVTAAHAAVLLAKLFNAPGPKRKPTVLVVDELDLLWTRKQDVLYNLFDWPAQKQSKLIVLAIANTMDLPERVMMNRIASRLGLTRMSFQPYTYQQLQQIISSRLNSMKAFEEDAIQLVSRKVAALSGDARRCLDICRRATEICEFASQKRTSDIVGMAHITEAITEMFSSPYISAIRSASLHEQIFLKAILAAFRKAGVEEATVEQVYHHHIALCRLEGMSSPTVSQMMAICSRLGACRLLLMEASNNYIHMRVRLNISQDDVMYALKGD